jgi:hypothetical protein
LLHGSQLLLRAIRWQTLLTHLESVPAVSLLST